MTHARVNEDWTVEFETVLLTEGEVDQTSRYFVEPSAMKLPERLPFPLTDGSGQIVGRVDRVWRDGNRIMASGVRAAFLADDLLGRDDAGYSLEASIEGGHVHSADDGSYEQTLTAATVRGAAVFPRQVARRPSE